MSMRPLKKYWPSFLRNRENNRSKEKSGILILRYTSPFSLSGLFSSTRSASKHERSSSPIEHPQHLLHAVKPCPFLWNKIPDWHKISWGFYFASIPVF